MADRAASAFVLVLLGLATLVFWVGIPVGGMWFFSKLTDSWSRHFLLSLVFIPVLMAVFTPALFWLNGLYLRITGAMPDEDDEERAWRMRGPLETFLYVGMAIAIVGLILWFFFIAQNPPETVW
jgi:hypothetical protein